MPLGPNSTGHLLQRSPLQSLLETCKSTKHLKQTHAHIIKQDPSPFNSSASTLLLSSYAVSPHGDISYAKTLFTHLQHLTVFLWNSIIRGLSASRNPLQAISFYHEMLRRGFQPNNFTYPFVIKACSESSSVRHGVMIHTHVVKTGLEADPYVQSTLIHFYANSKELEAARQVFDRCSSWDTVSWNSMIDGYVKCGELGLARYVFDGMDCWDVVSWNTLINGYALLGNLSEAQKLFAQMPHRNVVSWNSMLAGHAKCGDVEGACKIFSAMPHRDVVSWNTMLACYAQSGHSNEALILFDEMQCTNIKTTDATIVNLLSACAHLGALDRGEHLHAYIIEHKIELNTILGTALVDMYAKCGSISRATQVFNTIEQKDVLAWNTIISGMATHGHAEEACWLLNEMIESGIRPDDITFVAVLSACSHAGMVKEGYRLFNSMKGTYGIDPKVEHYGCVIDLLARAGLLEEAMVVIGTMPMEPNTTAWGALLGGCRIHDNIEVGEGVGKHLLNLQPEHSGRYALLFNIYATSKRWEEARKVRNMMDAKGVAKIPGLTMIELKEIVNRSVAGDQSHPEAEKIYSKLSRCQTIEG